ncbi:hypothetical protein [Nostocoides sp. HKS02]|uniref:hypothetical protein n=1 Tax=Nostocoides sp. HKS02 TaxID=1813880 RepID=UPI0012B4820C|nr:hypothetical protein [Tetrasphaera sp. HKS02]QGN59201.1 hypothetical protein GKE56_16385 [Tetrasphaera sp. HKS02]
MERDEAQSATFYDLDGQVLQLSFAGDSAALWPSGRSGVDELKTALAQVSGGEGDPDPRVVANQVLDNHWLNRWPRRPGWLRRLVLGSKPPTV